MPENDFKRLETVLSDAFEGNGIFKAFDCPVWEYLFDPSDLDIYFITNYGKRWAAPYLMHFVVNDKVSQENIKRVASNIYRMHKSQWEHLFKDMQAEYNPIFNTDAHEKEVISRTGHEDNLTAGTSSSATAGNADADSSGTTSFDNDKFGFNSSTAAHDRKGSGSSTAGTTSSNDSLTSNEMQNNATADRQEDIVREYTKEGNIGTMRTADIIKSDINLWRWNFIKTVMQDISDMLTLSTY